VKTAIDNEEFEKAAGHIHRFLAMDQVALRKTALHVAQGTLPLQVVPDFQWFIQMQAEVLTTVSLNWKQQLRS
jgi:hypothetical protein